jgi:hypothetical protein
MTLFNVRPHLLSYLFTVFTSAFFCRVGWRVGVESGLLTTARVDGSWGVSGYCQSYLTDALGERVWVDAPESVEFIANLVTVFGPPVVPGAPPAAGAGPAVDVWEEEVITKGGGAKSPRTLDDDAMWEEEEEISEASGGGDGLLDVRPRCVRMRVCVCVGVFLFPRCFIL